MFDVFYIGREPGLLPHETEVASIQEAQNKSRTRYCWIITYLADYSGWDFLWEPVPWQSQYVHVWPNQWHQYSGTFLVPKHTPEWQYYFHERCVPNKAHPDDFRMLMEGAEFDFTWAPHPLDPPFIYVFGNQWWPANKWATVEYHMPGATERKFIDQPGAKLPTQRTDHWKVLADCEWDFSWQPDPGDPPYIYVFGNQWHRAEVMPTVEYHAPGATERKFLVYPRAALLPDRSRWTVPDTVDDSEIDFSWVPDPGSPPYIYQFATQHQKTGGPQYHVPGATETKYLEQMRVHVIGQATAVIEIDHLDGNAGLIPGVAKTVRYFDNYLDILRRIAKYAQDQEHEFVWICSSICDYQDFDFSWHPEQWQATMLHVFASGEQKFGDTFFMHAPSFLIRSETCQLLEWYDLNFVNEISVPRRPMPVIHYDTDSIVDPIKTQTWSGPLALFVNRPVTQAALPTVPMWREKTKTVVPLDSSGSVAIVPRTAVPFIKTQVYDYAWIDKSHRNHFSCVPLDVIFISYDEHEADTNWQKLLDKCPRAKRVHGVAGMENALLAAAQCSASAWFYAVFGKTEIASDFGFDYFPDYFQQPKHYIFYSNIRANGLCYGEMGLIMYNSSMIVQNHGQEFDLDYTMSFPHEVIPIVSTLGNFDTSPYQSWRTAFRETAKLAYFQHTNPSVENEYHLKVWQSHAVGPYAEWVLRGATDGYEFWQEAQADVKTLKQSFMWNWLRQRFVDRYGELD